MFHSYIYQLIPHIMRSNIGGSGILKFFGIRMSHPKRASIASNSPCTLSLILHTLRSLNNTDAIGPFFLFPKFNIQFCDSILSVLFNPNLGTKSSLKNKNIYLILNLFHYIMY